MKSEQIRETLVERIKLAKEKKYNKIKMAELHAWLRQLNVIYPHIRKEYIAWLVDNEYIEIGKNDIVTFL